MPKPGFSPAVWRLTALEAMGKHLSGSRNARPLNSDELKKHQRRNATHGWRMSLKDSTGQVFEIDVITDRDFPYSAARLALAESLGEHSRPHIEADDVLCVLPGGSSISPRDPIGVLEEILSDAAGLLEHWLDRNSAQDFEAEFLSYWSYSVGENVPAVVSLVRPAGPSRRISAWHGERITVCADDRATLERWLRRFGPDAQGRTYRIKDGVLLWLDTPMHPAEYPKTGAGVLSLAEARCKDAVPLLLGSDAVGTRDLDVIIGATTPHGGCFASVRMSCPPEKELNKGFRPGHVPRAVLQNHYFSASRAVSRAVVQRADHTWIHGRDQDERQAVLMRKRVLVLGCGAIGSGVARLLAQAGVGYLTLVDRQIMDWPNVSRHALGVQAVGKAKSKALAEELTRDFPHLGEIESRIETFGVSSTALIDELPTFDLVVSATGVWGTDALLNDLRRAGSNMPPVVFAWMEPHAVAAHAVLLSAKSDGCLHCGFQVNGKPLTPVSTWAPSKMQFQEPACGATFSPFGAVELAAANHLTADLVLDVLLDGAIDTAYRVSVTSDVGLQRAGGAWNDHWVNQFPPHATNPSVVSPRWNKNPQCPACGD